MAPHRALVAQRDEVEECAHPRVALQLLPLPEVLLVRAVLDRLARRDRFQIEELEDPAQRAGRVVDELLVREDVHAFEALAVGLEQRMAAEPVLEHPVVAPRPAPPRGRDRDGDRVSQDHDERRAGIERLQEARLEEVRRRLLEQDGPVEIPVTRPVLVHRARVLRRDERRGLGQVRLGREAEPAGAAIGRGDRIDALEVLALVRRHARPREAADLGVRGEGPREQRRAAPVQPGEEDEPVPFHGGQS